MSGLLGPQSGAGKLLCNERGNTTRILLLVLLLVAAGGGYVYFFTDLIRPKEPAKPPVAQTAPVKNPIPPRADQPAGAPGAAAKPEQVTAPAPVAAPAPAPPPAGKAATPPAPAPPAQPKGTAPPAAPAKTAQPAPAPAAVPVTTPKAAPPAQTTAPAAPAAPAKAAAPAAPPKTGAVTEKAAAKDGKAKAKGSYTLLLGEFVPDSNLDQAIAKLKRNHISPVKKHISTASRPMNRLFVAEFSDQERAESELQQLKKMTPDAFLIATNGRYTLYGGSYYTADRVKTAVRRLEEKGVKPVVRKTKIPIKMARLTAGSYSTLEEATKASGKAKKLGFTARVVKSGK